MKFFATAFASSLALFAPVATVASELPVGGACDKPQTVTKLSFFDADLIDNTLHVEGGRLRYTNVGKLDDEPFDMTVKVAGGTYTNIVNAWEDKGKTAETQNGFSSDNKFGRINLYTERGVSGSGKGSFRFCLVKKDSEETITLKNFTFSIWDLDWRYNETDAEPDKVSIRERMFFDTSQAKNFSLFPDFENSQVKVRCEDGTPVEPTDPDGTGVDPGSLSCPGGETIFDSSEFGVGADNPGDPEELNDLQRSRAVSILFEDTDCWELTYDHYCPVDEGLDDRSDKCQGKAYAGGNFLFAGESDALFNAPDCPTEAPVEPTYTPTATPTVEPSAPTDAPIDPTDSPTATPTVEPSAPTDAPIDPTDSPTATPTVEPSAPTDSPIDPTDPPTATPTVEPSAPTDAPVDPTDTPTVEPSAPTDSPVDPTDAPTVEPSAPTDSPVDPTDAPTVEPSAPTDAPVDPTDAPTVEPSAPTDAPVDPTDAPTVEPSAPTDAPVDPTAPPTLPPPECPEDIVIIDTDGVTEIEATDAVRIISQDTDTVTVRLYQAWTSSAEAEVDGIFYSYRKDNKENEVCVKEEDVPGQAAYEDITIQCLVNVPNAFLTICVEDEGGALDSDGDNAEIPKCCKPKGAPETPTVCYKMRIKCDTLCIESIGRRALRGAR